ncbi:MULTISPECIES: glycosyltransferase family 2 protein [Agrobacterium]
MATKKNEGKGDSRMLSVVVPCYNEVDGLGELHRRVTEVCVSCVSDQYELILVNDGSSDGTWAAMSKLAERDRHIVAVNLSRNHGHQLALTAGLNMCRGDRVFILDADLQDPPELLTDMMSRMDLGCDVVFGQRIKREGETAFKRASAFIFYRLLNRIVDIDIPPDTGDFRLMSRRALDVLNSMPEHHRFIRGMVSWIGLRQEAVQYERAPRFVGETKYPLHKMIRFAIDAITGFSIRPLRVATYVGLGFGFLELLLLGYVIVEYLLGNTIEGWASLAVIVLAVGSVQLFVAGIMGEYLGRLYIESKGRPLFIIQDVLCSEELVVNTSTVKALEHGQRDQDAGL